MRADRLVSLVLLLRQRGRLSATSLAEELEVSTRTVLRDIDSLMAAGVPIYAERGRHGGFVLLPGFRTELTGLSHDEALALLVAGSRHGDQAFGLGSALASAMRKVVDALPDSYREAATFAAERLLIDPQTDLLSKPTFTAEIANDTLAEIRHAVFAGRKLRIHYASADGSAEAKPNWRTVDPIGLVTARERGYLLATRSGENRTYRLSRVMAAEALSEPAHRPSRVDLDKVWRERSVELLTHGNPIEVFVRVKLSHRDDLLRNAQAVRVDAPVRRVASAASPKGETHQAPAASRPDVDGWLQLAVTFSDISHAEWTLWQLGTNAEALSPQSLRKSLESRAVAIATLYSDKLKTV